MSESIVPYSLDDYFKSSSIGPLDKAIGNNLYGLNHMQTPGAVPSNKDVYGLTFFVRPQLNLQADNIRNYRKLSHLLNQVETSVQRYVRCMLDPRLIHGYTFNNHTIPTIRCPLVDNANSFIPVLTNNLVSISGWPDLAVPTFTSDPGLYREQYSQVDGIVNNYESYQLTATFRNTKGDPILYMFYVWLHYMSCVFEGRMSPYIDMITENEIDYMTRIYRITLDQQKKTVTKIIACGAAFPLSDPIGSFGDFNIEHPYNDQNKEIPIRFQCLGFECFDDILVKEFNDSIQIFNGGMRDGVREGRMFKLEKDITHLFKYKAYPRIEPNTYELEWWVDSFVYNNVSKEFIQKQIKPQEILNQDSEFSGD